MVVLNPDLKARLVALIDELLPTLEVEQGVFLSLGAIDRLESLDRILPDAHKAKLGGDPSRRVKPILIEMIDDRPVSEFAADYIGLLLERSSQYDASAPTLRIADVIDASDLARVGTEIVAGLEALPRRYTISFLLGGQLGGLIPRGDRVVRINDRMRLVRIDEQFRAETPGAAGAMTLGSIASLVGSLSYWPIADGEVVLQIDVAGFCRRYGQTATLMEALLQAKAFFALCLATDLLAADHATRSGPSRLGLVIGDSDAKALVSRRDLDHDTSALLSRLSVSPRIYEKPAPTERIALGLAAIGRALAAGDECKRLRLACRWFFDSCASADDVTAYVQAMIVMETLLGEGEAPDRNSITLGELLKNRCAYLLGNTRADRDHILERFPVLYRLRSAIVHNGHHKLSSKEREQLYELRYLCGSVIRAEARLLTARM